MMTKKTEIMEAILLPNLPLNSMSISPLIKVLSHHLFPPTSRKDGDKPDTSGFLGLLRKDSLQSIQRWGQPSIKLQQTLHYIQLPMKTLTFEQMVQRLILWIKFITKNKTMRSMPVLNNA